MSSTTSYVSTAPGIVQEPRQESVVSENARITVRAVETTATTQLSNQRRVGLAVFVLLANMVQMISNSVTLVAGVPLAKALNADNTAVNWLGASYPLTQGTFVLVSGRLGEKYGHRNMLLLGLAWFSVWSIINNFCDTFLTFNIARGFTGFGGALILPNAVAMIGITFPPGKLRNFCLGLFGAAAPTGGYLAAVFAGIFTQFTDWRYLFVFLGALGCIILGILWFLLPHEAHIHHETKMDWVGAFLGTVGLILFNFPWNQAPATGWSNPSQYATLVAGIITFAAFAVWEWKFAADPIMPLAVFKAPSFLPLLFVVLMSTMSFGALFWYLALWLEVVRGWSVLHFAAGFTPFLFFGVFAAWLASWLVPRLSAQWIVALGLLTVTVANVLTATMPEQQTYWAQTFPAIVIMSFCPDLEFTAAQIVASNAVHRRHQGVAASLIGVLQLYGTSTGLGFAGTVEAQVIKAGYGQVHGYRAALWFCAAMSAVALFIDVVFIRIEKDEREGWAEDDADAHELDRIVASIATGIDVSGRT